MSNIRLNIDTDAIAEFAKEFKEDLKRDLQRSVGLLATQTYAHVKELAANELHSSLSQFQDNVGFEEISPGIWVVSIDKPALWIEEGLPQDFDMKPGILAKGAKTSKDGHKYRVVPFDQGKAPSQSTGFEKNLINQIKSQLKDRGIPFKKIEKDVNGNPRLGKLHTLNLDSDKPSTKASTPALQGLNIYQTRTASGSVRRDITTFRTVSDGPAGADKFKHPGYTPKKFLDRSAQWAENQWENIILPQLLEKYSK